ncbi:MAG: HD domain-containing protein [Firmicutes bacterium]|nr:HD domain-containing protein [Bacillota bacterium]
MQIKEIVKEGTVSGTFLVLESQWRVARNGSPFAALRIGDRSGEIALKVWEITEEVFRDLAKGKVLKLRATAKNFNGILQLEANGKEEFFQVCREGEFDPASFLPTTTVKLEDLWAIVDRVRADLKTKPYQLLIEYFFADPEFRQKFTRAPAALKIHHAYLGGLLEHTAGVVTLCRAAADYYPGVNRDLLLTGALLHDVGKVDSYTSQPMIEGTDPGRLIGHLVLGVQMVSAAISAIRQQQGEEAFPVAAELPLLHLLVSHHGKMEWGSPLEPALLEACLLHQADNMDAEAAKFREAIAKHPSGGGNWTAYNTILKRSVYLTDLEEPESDPRALGSSE